MDTRTERGKAIIGLAMAAVMVVALVAMVPTVSAGQGSYPLGEGQSLLTIVKGTKHVNVTQLQWVNTNEAITIVGKTGTDIEGETHTINNASDFEVSTAWSKGLYSVLNSSGKPAGSISVVDPTLTAEIYLEDGTKVTNGAIVENQPFYVKVTTNFGAVLGNDGDRVTMKLSVVNPDNTAITEDQSPTPKSFTRTDVNTDTVRFPSENTSDYYHLTKRGTFTITAKLPTPGVNHPENNELEKSATSVTLDITTEAVSVDIETPEVMKGETVIVTGTGKSKTWYNLMISSGGGVFKTGVKDVRPGNYTASNGSVLAAPSARYATVKTDAAGKFRAEISTTGIDTGAYTVYVMKTDADLPEVGEEEDKDEYRVTEVSVTLTTDKATYVVGEDVVISGEAITGDYVIIAIDEEVVKYERIKADKTYEYRWTDSEKKIPGSYKIEVWNYPHTWSTWGSKYKDITESPDATVTIYLAEPSLTAEVSRTTVALGDEFWIRGTAPGQENVNLIVVSPKGTGGTVIDTGTVTSLPSIYYRTVSVSTVDYTFEHKVSVDENSDSGNYLVAVLSPGKDKQYNGLPAGTSAAKFVTELRKQYGLDTSSKSQDAMVSVIKDATVDAAGSDDFIVIAYVKCEEGKVLLNPIANVGVGEPLVVSGTTNRKDNHPIVITVKGPKELPAKTAYVENGTFNVTFDTTGATVGTYTVKADDGDGHIDEATVEILTAAPTPTPTATPTATRTPTSTPSPAGKIPGFEAIIAISTLIAVAYILRLKI